tara:strand:- start:1098 stop:2036 length:939 start_codon:yes stop_codon:yes gene_type:complete
MFDETWAGEYCHREMIFQDPTILDGVDVCIMVVEWDYSTRPEVGRAVDYGVEHGVVMGCSGNGPYHKNILLTPPNDNELRRKFSFYIDPATDDATKAAFERVLGIPYFGGPPPFDKAAFDWEFEQAESKDWVLPDYIEGSFLMGHELLDECLMTLLCAEAFDIPIVVTLWKHVQLTHPHYGQDHCEAFVQRYEEATGFKNINFYLGMNQHQWTYALRRSRGLFYMTEFPSGGRPQTYAAAMGKPSMATRSAWQVNLYPDDVLPYGIEGAIDWQEREKRAIENAPKAQARLQNFLPEASQQRWQGFLTENGWA